MDFLTWLLQILILTLGIYLFLRFLRTTQGNRIVRGLAIAVPLLIIITWGTAYTLQLEELRHILRSVAGPIACLSCSETTVSSCSCTGCLRWRFGSHQRR